MNQIQQPVLVTGGTGFIGSHLIDKLLAQGLEVRSFSLPNEQVPDHWQGRVKVLTGDICNKTDVANAMQGIGTVFHLAALVTGGDYEPHYRIAVEGARNIFDAALSHKSKVILCSSITVYGEQIAQGVCHDGLEHGAQYHGPYSRAKMAQEKLAVEYRDNKGMPLVVIRPANVYGNGSSWVDGVVSLIQADLCPVIGDGSGDAGLVHVSNLADAFILAASHPDALGQIYTVADEFGISWNTYFNDLASIYGKSPLPCVPLSDALAKANEKENLSKLIAPPADNPMSREVISMIGYANRYDSSKIRKQLGWTATLCYDEAMSEIAAYLGD